MTAPATGAPYDGHADWYDAWAHSDGATAMAAAEATQRRRGYIVVGADVSADQLRLARSRIPVVRADGGALPLRDGVARLAVSVLTHTDVDDYGSLVAEAVRVLEPSGCFVHVGVHPCFVSPVAERLTDGVRIHPGYRAAGWQGRTPFTGNAVRSRVGAHHLPCRTC